MFQELKDDLEIIFCISASAIERNKIRGEYGITYDAEIMKLIDKSKKMGFKVDYVRHDVLRRADGTLTDDYGMVKKL